MIDLDLFMRFDDVVHDQFLKQWFCSSIRSQILIFLFLSLLTALLSLFPFLADFPFLSLISFNGLKTHYEQFPQNPEVFSITAFNRSNSSLIRLSTCLLISSSTSIFFWSLMINSSTLCRGLWDSFLFDQVPKIVRFLNLFNFVYYQQSWFNSFLLPSSLLPFW